MLCFFFFFSYFQMVMSYLKYPFPLLSTFYIKYLTIQWKSGGKQVLLHGFHHIAKRTRSMSTVFVLTVQHISWANLYVCWLGHESHSWTCSMCGFDIHLDFLKWCAWPTEDNELYTIQANRAMGSCFLRIAGCYKFSLNFVVLPFNCGLNVLFLFLV